MYPTFRKGWQIMVPISLLLVNIVTVNSFIKYRRWILLDSKETRLGLAQSHIFIIISSILAAIIYLISSLVIFNDAIVYVGDWCGQLLNAILNYYFVTVCLRFGELKAIEDMQEAQSSNTYYQDNMSMYSYKSKKSSANSMRSNKTG